MLFCLFANVEGKTINNVDSIGLKQGVWREFRAIPISSWTGKFCIPNPLDSTQVIAIDSFDFEEEVLISESYGQYVNNLKQGVWLEFNPYGKYLMNKIEYIDGVPNGKCELYWYNGTIKMKCNITDSKYIKVESYTEQGQLFDERMMLKSELIKTLYEK